MGLKAVAFRRRLAVIAHGDGQEVILDVGIFHPRFRADEGAGLELVRSAEPLAGEQPLRADDSLAPEVPVLEQGDRQARGELQVKFHVVLQVRAHLRAVEDDGDAEAGEVVGGTDAGKLQEAGGADGSR